MSNISESKNHGRWTQGLLDRYASDYVDEWRNASQTGPLQGQNNGELQDDWCKKVLTSQIGSPEEVQAVAFALVEEGYSVFTVRPAWLLGFLPDMPDETKIVMEGNIDFAQRKEEKTKQKGTAWWRWSKRTGNVRRKDEADRKGKEEKRRLRAKLLIPGREMARLSKNKLKAADESRDRCHLVNTLAYYGYR